MTAEDSERTEAFIRLLAEHERNLAVYAHAMVPHQADAEDILQEAKVVMWRHFHQFKLGTNFGAWSRKVVFHQVLAFRKRKQRDRLWFTDEFLETVHDETERNADRLEQRDKVLAGCIAKLGDEHRQIVELRYAQNASIEAIAEKVGRTEGAVYRVLSRIRRALHDCVTDTLNHRSTSSSHECGLQQPF